MDDVVPPATASDGTSRMTNDQPDPGLPLGTWRSSDKVADACAQLLTHHPLGRLLDAGGGEGFVTRYLMSYRAVETAVVVDQCDDILSQVPEPIQTKRGRLEDLGHDDGEFSTILVRQVLHYIQSPETVLGRLRRLLGPGGVIYVGQLVAPGPASARWLGDAAHWVSPTRHRVWTANQLVATFTQAGLRLEQAVMVPHWQALDEAAKADHDPTNDNQADHDRAEGTPGRSRAARSSAGCTEVRRLLKVREHEGTLCCQVYWLHALLRAETHA